MWLGYFSLGGVEFANNGRVETYARTAGYHGIKSRFSSIPVAGVPAPSTAAADNAAWYDPDVPESADFHGVFVLSVDGLAGSTLTASPTPSVDRGGRSGRARHDGRTLVFNTVLAAKSEAGLEYGIAWLSQVLAGPESTPGCEGAQLLFYARGSGLAADQRRMNRASTTVAPSVAGRRKAACGHRLAMVTFTMYVGDPSIYGQERLIVRDWAAGSDPYTAPGAVLTAAAAFTDPDCPASVRTPLYDPLRPAMTPPPQYPEVPLDDYAPPTSWTRRTLYIPPSMFPEWGEILPTISLQVGSTAVRNARFKFYPSTNGSITDQCGWTDDLLLTYLPSLHTLVIDGTTNSVIAHGPVGEKRNADTLVLAADGSPLQMPILTGGTGYVVAFDLAANQPVPEIQISLTTRNSIQAAA